MKTSKKSYNLKSFTKLENNLELNSSIEFRENLIYLSYSLVGDISSIIIPDTSNIQSSKADIILNKEETFKLGKRKDNLWKSTCFELFLASKTNKKYLELNISPSLDFNIYKFSDYRLGMKNENNLEILEINRKKEDNYFALNFIIRKKTIFNIKDIIFNISAIIKYSNDKSMYYAINHDEKKPDFHKKENFVSFS